MCGAAGRWLVLTVHVGDDLVTVHPAGALVSQQRRHPPSVAPVHADVQTAEVTLSGRGVHADREVPDLRPGGWIHRCVRVCVCKHVCVWLTCGLTHLSSAVYSTAAAAPSGGSHLRTRSML